MQNTYQKTWKSLQAEKHKAVVDSFLSVAPDVITTDERPFKNTQWDGIMLIVTAIILLILTTKIL